MSVIATLLSVGYGWLVKQGKLPLNSVMALNDAQFGFIKVWAKLAAVIGIILPIVMWIIFWHEPMVRIFFGCYLLTVVIQLVSETVFSRTLCKSVVVMGKSALLGSQSDYAEFHGYSQPLS